MYAQVYPQAFARQKVIEQWGSHAQFVCLRQMWERESHWNPLAHNKRSGAFGIAQFMPSTWGNYNLPYKPTSVSVQITGGLRYITKRYGSPCQAWKFWQRHFWY
jgi:hypothetical protein